MSSRWAGATTPSGVAVTGRDFIRIKPESEYCSCPPHPRVRRHHSKPSDTKQHIRWHKQRISCLNLATLHLAAWQATSSHTPLPATGWHTCITCKKRVSSGWPPIHSTYLLSALAGRPGAITKSSSSREEAPSGANQPPDSSGRVDTTSSVEGIA